MMPRDSSLSATSTPPTGSERQYEAWERLAPLDEAHRDSIRDLQRQCLDLPVSNKFITEPTVATRKTIPSDASSNLGVGNNPLPGASSNLEFAEPSVSLPPNLAKILPTEPIHSASSFLLWLDSLEPTLLTNQEKTYKYTFAMSFAFEAIIKDYQTLLSKYKQRATSLLTELNEIKHFLSELSAYQAQFQEQLSAIRTQCAGSLENKLLLERQISQIEIQLRPFDQLSQISHFLTRPGNDLCVNPRFETILQQLDSGIAFMREHSNFKDASVYLARHQQNLTRALSLIHLYFSDRLEALKSPGAEGVMTFGTLLAENHQNFRYLASEMRPLICHIESRSHAHIDYTNLLTDCHKLFLKARLQFFRLHLPNLIDNNDIFDALIDGAAQMQAVLRDEELLFHTFFTEGEAELAIHLDELLALFYELWSNNFAKRLKDRTAPLQSSAAEATAFLRSQVRILESTNFSKAGQKVASILATVELRFLQF